MYKIKLTYPSIAYKQNLLNYRQEFIERNESMDGSAGFEVAETFEEWLENWQYNQHEETVKEGLVCATTFIAVDEYNTVVGMLDIRHTLNDYLLNYGGHIGYSVAKAYRRKGIATEMLKQGLEICREMDIKDVLITCDKDNIGSAHTIMNNGGELENEISNGDKIIQRYWITLK